MNETKERSMQELVESILEHTGTRSAPPLSTAQTVAGRPACRCALYHGIEDVEQQDQVNT